MSKSLLHQNFVRGADIRLSATFTAVAEVDPQDQVNLLDATCTLSIYSSNDARGLGTGTLITLAIGSGITRRTNTSTVQSLRARIAGAATTSWPLGILYYRFRLTTAAGEVLMSEKYDGEFRLGS